jgi:hypothetical protein
VRCQRDDYLHIYTAYIFLKYILENSEVDATGSGSCPVTGFDVTVVRSVAFFSRESVSFLVISEYKIQ